MATSIELNTQLPAANIDGNNDTLNEFESFWRYHQVWLAEKGYMLRPRYRPGWVASWKSSSKPPVDCEDSLTLVVSVVRVIEER